MSDVYEGEHRRPNGVEPAPMLRGALFVRVATGATHRRAADLSKPPAAPNGCEGCGAEPGGEHTWSCDAVPAETFKRALAAGHAGGA